MALPAMTSAYLHWTPAPASAQGAEWKKSLSFSSNPVGGLPTWQGGRLGVRSLCVTGGVGAEAATSKRGVPIGLLLDI